MENEYCPNCLSDTSEFNEQNYCMDCDLECCDICIQEHLENCPEYYNYDL